MHLAFLNPQGNFDSTDRGWAAHPDFGGQLVYVKEVALALGQLGHRIDIVTRQVVDAAWPEFAGEEDAYPGHANVRILRFPCGPAPFLSKEALWPHLHEWVDTILDFYQKEGSYPDAATGHYGDGGLAAALIQERTGIPFTFTGHSLGAQKIDKLVHRPDDFAEAVERFHFDKRIAAERVSMARAGRIVTSTRQERLEQYSHRLYHGAVDPADEATFAVVPPGVNLAVFGADQRNAAEDEIAQKIEAMLRRDLPEARRRLPLVISSSRLDRKKNHLATVQAWAASEALRASANLAIVVRGSSDPLRELDRAFSGEALEILREIVAVCDARDLWPCLTAFDLNNQAELAACYRYLAQHKQGIFCLTASYEPFGLAPLEAMAAGLPAVVTKNGGPSESLQDAQGRYGVLVDPHDPRDIAAGLVRLTRDEAAWKTMQQAGMQRIADHYTWQRTAQGYGRVIQQMLNDDAENHSHPIPTYFKTPAHDDIDPAWLAGLYFAKTGST